MKAKASRQQTLKERIINKNWISTRKLKIMTMAL